MQRQAVLDAHLVVERDVDEGGREQVEVEAGVPEEGRRRGRLGQRSLGAGLHDCQPSPDQVKGVAVAVLEGHRGGRVVPVGVDQSVQHRALSPHRSGLDRCCDDGQER